MKIIFRFLLLLGFSSFSMAADECPAIPPVPVPDAEDLAYQHAWQRVAEPYLARYAVSAGSEPAYGVGYLDVLNENEHYYDWPRKVVLPLWSAPSDNAFSGWLHSGRVYLSRETAPRALTGLGMVETAYENSNFIVYEALDSGWLRIKWAPGNNGDIWVHRCYLEFGEARLAYKNWASYLTAHSDWLHFRSRVPHVLRSAPSADSPQLTMIGLDHKLVLLGIHGDWMRVRVEQPDQTCRSDPDRSAKGLVDEGWVRWRDDQMGPWVWVYTRGC